MPVMTAFTNNEKQTVNIGGRSVQPGETREVDARFVSAAPETNRQIIVLYINFGITPKYFGTTVVQPNTAARLPIIHFENPNKADAGAFQDAVFSELLEKSIEDIKPFFSSFEDDELERLAELEQSDGKRKTLLKEITDTLAARKEDREFDPQKYAQSLEGKDESELQVELLAAGDNELKLKAIQDALAKLKAIAEQ
ncbi:ABC transporter ATPase [Vibrio sp. SCSIO 43169]|uniref:ABC transporter ATPase n=1 Tax=Vibrio sp. SCSIO 43169 TaxID=2822801 RepID=UPI00204375FA|nr:ABC transporter ATPase [Vibrio sp. SCSIO 43169]MCM5507125.1 ABC transporter ATPase [Vibrio sp. SCSIO 43169]